MIFKGEMNNFFSPQILGASYTFQIPEWGAVYYDNIKDTWNDFGSSPEKAWKFKGKPRFCFKNSV